LKKSVKDIGGHITSTDTEKTDKDKTDSNKTNS
jgi:hypothetical protein